MTLLRFDARALVKIGHMRGTPSILEYRASGKNLEVRTIRREGRSRNEVGTLRDFTPITATAR